MRCTLQTQAEWLGSLVKTCMACRAKCLQILQTVVLRLFPRRDVVYVKVLCVIACGASVVVSVERGDTCRVPVPAAIFGIIAPLRIARTSEAEFAAFPGTESGSLCEITRACIKRLAARLAFDRDEGRELREMFAGAATEATTSTLYSSVRYIERSVALFALPRLTASVRELLHIDAGHQMHSPIVNQILPYLGYERRTYERA